MGLFPFNSNWLRKAQTDQKGKLNDLLSVVRCNLGSPAVDDDDWFVVSANMKVGAYTLAHTSPDVPRNVTVTHTAVGAADTLGTIDIVGKDANDAALTETITPVSGTVVAGTKAFKTITSITGVGWVIGEGNDTVKIGFGGKVGIPDKLPSNSVLFAVLDGTREATAPTVTVSSTILALNTVDFSTAWASTKIAEIYYCV